MQRGDLITVALQGDVGKPRLALVIQADHFADLPTLIVLPLTSTILDLPLVRVTVDPGRGQAAPALAGYDLAAAFAAAAQSRPGDRPSGRGRAA